MRHLLMKLPMEKSPKSVGNNFVNGNTDEANPSVINASKIKKKIEYYQQIKVSIDNFDNYTNEIFLRYY